jgi:hypothetical protein
VSVVSAIAGIAGRRRSVVSVLTNSVASPCASAALPPLPQMRIFPPARTTSARSEAAFATSSAQCSARSVSTEDASVM